MAALSSVDFLSIIVILTVTASGVVASPPVVKAAYWPSWDSNFPPSAIETSYFTHIYYAFLVPSNASFKFEISNSMALTLSNFTTILHHKNPPVKMLFSIGVGGSDSLLFARMASSASSRRTFINSAIEVARRFGFDGQDLDWEFPEGPKEMKDLGYLFKDWRLAIQRRPRPHVGHLFCSPPPYTSRWPSPTTVGLALTRRLRYRKTWTG